MNKCNLNKELDFEYIQNEDERTRKHKIKVSNPTIFFVYSGELQIYSGRKKIIAENGESLFLQGNRHICFVTKSKDNQAFCGIFIRINRSYLSGFIQRTHLECPTRIKDEKLTNVIKIPCTPYMKSLHISIMPYLKKMTKPENNILEIKQLECIHCIFRSEPLLKFDIMYNKKSY